MAWGRSCVCVCVHVYVCVCVCWGRDKRIETNQVDELVKRTNLVKSMEYRWKRKIA